MIHMCKEIHSQMVHIHKCIFDIFFVFFVFLFLFFFFLFVPFMSDKSEASENHFCGDGPKLEKKQRTAQEIGRD